jgi:predicted dehydrogenase
MAQPLRLAVAGLGRIGAWHARHVQEMAAQEGLCCLTALVDTRIELARQLAALLQLKQQPSIACFATVEEMLDAGIADAVIVSTPTGSHEPVTRALVAAGCRVLLEKPLTHSLETDRAFASWIDHHAPNALMLAFQRRFDGPLQFAYRLLQEGRIGEPFKIVSILEDSGPPPAGYSSPGIVLDMAVHNIDEVCWFFGSKPERVKAFGASLYNHKISPVEEDFDDAVLHLDFAGGRAAHIQVSRNHVAGYHVATTVYGPRGVIQIGPFRGRPSEVFVGVYGPRSILVERTFLMPQNEEQAPEFLARFGPAYKEEVREFVRCCVARAPFPVTHKHGLEAMEVAAAATASMR